MASHGPLEQFHLKILTKGPPPVRFVTGKTAVSTRLRGFPMLSRIINNPRLERYAVTFKAGETIFLEGDDTQDLYFLVSGKIGILKGRRSIAEISDQGSIFGEMSFLLGEKRTATVKAVTDVKAVRIPKEEISSFITQFPEVMEEFARFLARRLDETSQILFGLKEVCDQIPDAVFLTDKGGKILSWNSAAENLYGREESEMRYRSAEEIYEDPHDYRAFLNEAVSGNAIREKVLKIRHPEEGIRYVSTSTKVLYDGQHNFQGILSLARDVTSTVALERRYRRVRRWLLPTLFLVVVLAGGIFFGYPYFSKGYRITDIRKQKLRDNLAVSSRLLRSVVLEPFEAGDRGRTTQVLKSFFDVQKDLEFPCTGVLLLNRDKMVFDSYSIDPKLDPKGLVGTSYAGISLEGRDGPIYQVLSLYRTHKDHPMGFRSIELAFKLYKEDRFLGWLIFQMNMDLLKRKFKVDEEDLRRFRFEESEKEQG